MAYTINENGDISLIQGDSVTLVISGINTDKNYTVYFAVQDINRKPVGNEISVSTNYQSSVIFQLTGDFTDLLAVNKNEPFATYYYGIKVCDSTSQYENTLSLGNNNIGSLNTITVYPKKVEGI